jgi:diguanylate cyclase (GGDEF)-like protein/PAS domain S-box-containing protein
MTETGEDGDSTCPDALRAAAERKVAGHGIDVGALSKDDVRAIVHEFQVHQIELELQNEELQRANAEIESLRANLDDLYQNAPIGYLTLHPDGPILKANLAAAEILGCAQGELEGLRFYQFVVARDQKRYFAHRRSISASGEHGRCELHIRTRDDRLRYIRLDSQPKLDADGSVLAYRTVFSDITEMKQLQDNLRVAASVIDATSQAIAVMDVDGVIKTSNPAFARLIGPKANSGTLQELADEPGEALLRSVWNDLLQEGHWAGELNLHGHEGREVPVWAALSTVKEGDGLAMRVAGIFNDISAQKEASEHMYHLANYDSVTNLPNRRLFAERLAHTARQVDRNGSGFALLYLDLDRFKQINDTLGHEAGDVLLVQVAARLSNCLRKNDTLARIGGDEFAFVLPDIIDAQNAATVAEKIIAEFHRPIKLDDSDIDVGVSIGIAMYQQDTPDLAALQRYADTAMYEVKRTGRNSYRFFSRALTSAAKKHLDLENELRSAWEQNEFRVHYQPAYLLESRKLLGIEALLRWEHPVHGMLRAERFLSVTEDSGLIHEIGDWMLETVCSDAHAWHGLLPAEVFSLWINVSGSQLSSAVIHERLRQAFVRLNHEHIGLVLEITENTVMDEIHRSVERLNALKETGFRLAMDNFGKGYACLGLLQDIPFDIVKIDMDLVHDLVADRPAALVDAVIAMAHGLGLSVVAEGVESQEQMRIVKAKGCDAAQGYCLCRPLDAAALGELLLKDATPDSDNRQ